MSTEVRATNDLPIVCDPTPLTEAQKQHWIDEIAPKLYKAVQEIQELPDGYAWRLPSEPEILMLLAEDLNFERLCCPFLRYTLEIEPNHGAFWLRMTGSEGVKDFLRLTYESTNLFDLKVAQAAGFDMSAGKDMNSVETVMEAIDTINEQFAQTSRS